MGWMTLVDQFIHVATALISVVLFVISRRVYGTERDEKFLYVSAAFGFFFIKEALLLFQSFAGSWWAIDFSAHILNLVILACFFRGTVK